MASAITWFQIPATDSARAKAFYETICGFQLLPLDAGPGMQMWGFPPTGNRARSAAPS